MKIQPTALLAVSLIAPPGLAVEFRGPWCDTTDASRGLLITRRNAHACALVFDLRSASAPIWYIAPELALSTEESHARPIMTGRLFHALNPGADAEVAVDSDAIGEIIIVGHAAPIARVAYTVSGNVTTGLMHRVGVADAESTGRWATPGLQPVPLPQNRVQRR
jgi:hypothetical protein